MYLFFSTKTYGLTSNTMNQYWVRKRNQTFSTYGIQCFGNFHSSQNSVFHTSKTGINVVCNRTDSKHFNIVKGCSDIFYPIPLIIADEHTILMGRLRNDCEMFIHDGEDGVN